MVVVAFLTAALVGSAVFPYRRYRFWWKWSRPVFGLSLLAIFAINGVIGTLGVGIAHGIGWDPWQEPVRNGISFAMLGLAVVRVGLPGVDIDRQESSRQALSTIMRWIVSLLDDFADNRIRESLSRLGDGEIRELVSYILTKEVIPDKSLDSQDRAVAVDKMAKADNRLTGGDDTAWAEMLAWCVLQTRLRLLVIDRLRPASATV
jgi:hypothetical protein